MIVKFAGQTEVQVSANGQLSLLPQPYSAPTWQPPVTGNIQLGSEWVSAQGSTFSIFDDFLIPQTHAIKEPSVTTPYRPMLSGNSQFSLREGLPNRFKTERLPLSTDELVSCIAKRIDLNAQILNAGLRKNLKITRKTIDNIFGKPDETVDSIQARLSNADIARRAQRVLFEVDCYDPRDLNSLLLARLRSEYNEHQGMDLNEQDLARALNLILATFPHLVREASRACSARFKELFDAATLPAFIEAPDCVSRSRLNVYGIMPQDINDTERRFVEQLDGDTSGIVAWWHRNEARKPWSVGIVLPGGDRYFPDFIVGVKNRLQGDGLLLVEIKGGHIINYEDTWEKINAEHKQYGKSLMLTRQEDGRFWIMRYIEQTRKIEQDQVFRVENMGQY
jgi:hypothetical protein